MGVHRTFLAAPETDANSQQPTYLAAEFFYAPSVRIT